MACLYLLGGRQKDLIFRREGEWNLYESAIILEVDTDAETVRTCVEYRTPTEARAHEKSSSIFKSGTLVGNLLYACTNTEVLIYRMPEFERLRYVSLPCFNDLHHVIPASDGLTLLAASTGLDMVVRFTPDGEIVEAWDVLQKRLWTRFSQAVDYRKVATTQPHLSHPNFLFYLDGQLWVTRFEQRDAVCLSDPEKRIEIGVEAPHDGLVCGDRVYFTVVDGRLVIANGSTLKIDSILDFKSMDSRDSLLGWCRGILPIGEEKFWVGFSKVRKTRFDRNVIWVKRVLKEGMIARPTHISLYDVGKKERLQEIDLERHGMDSIFSILPAP
jgi:hypothetical protein